MREVGTGISTYICIYCANGGDCTTKENMFILKGMDRLLVLFQLTAAKQDYKPNILRTNFSEEERYTKFYLKSPDFSFLNTMWTKQNIRFCPKFINFNLEAE